MYIDKQGRKWFKGNLHIHTTESDGDYTPEQAIELYRSRGYDFVSITDHWTYQFGDELDGFTVLAGDEYNVGKDVREGVFHILGIGAAEKPKLKHDTATAQSIIDEIHNADGIAILAHPAWSLNTHEQITSLHGFDGVEIFNSISRGPLNCERANSGVIVDMLAANGLDLPLYANDDVHFYVEGYEKCVSYIMVNAESCSRDDLVRAMREGQFYATQGPEVYTNWDGEVLHVECSPASRILVCSDCVWSPKRSIVGEGLTSYDYVPVPRDSFLRVEVTDSDGKCAWSQITRIVNR